MKIAIAQINTSNGDLQGNHRKIRKFLDSARKESPSLILFPELSVVGYPPKDFLFQHGFTQHARRIVDQLAKDYQDLKFMVGSVENDSNVVYYIANGVVQTVFQKNLLPNYDIFDEKRYFRPGIQVQSIELDGKKIGITICEDIWFEDTGRYDRNPVEQFKNQHLDFLINISASPYEIGKHEHRKKIVSHHAQNLNIPVVYVNLVGGNDELIFDGGSFAMSKEGKVIHQLECFREELRVIDMNSPFQNTHEYSQLDELISALSMGIRDFVRKCGFEKVILGLSGGIDSALVLLLSIEALGKDNVHAVFMPSQYTSSISKEDVRIMVDSLQMGLTIAPIDRVVQAYDETLGAALDSKLKKLTLENIQARTRGAILMACSSEKKCLVMGTGNKSELATGYATIYGDLIGGLLPIGDLYKHQVYALTRKLNQKYNAIPDRVFDRAPSAELSEDQKDSDTLPEYDTLDPLVRSYVEHFSNEEDLLKQNFSKKTIDQFVSMNLNSEFKRRQAPPILRVSSKAFGTGRRMPIARKAYDV